MPTTDADKIQDDIDVLLAYMNDDIENNGWTIEGAIFGFLNSQEDYKVFMSKSGWDDNNFAKILKICFSRSLVKHHVGMHPEQFGAVGLTPEGQSRAISVKHGKNRSYELGSGTQIASLTVHGPAQVGNGNVQNFQNFLGQLNQQIEAADATEAE